MWYGSMVVRIVHGQAGSLYAALLKEGSGANSHDKAKEVQPKADTSVKGVVHQAPASDAVKVTLSSQSGPTVSNLVRAASLNESVVSVKSMRGAVGSERIEHYKDAKQVTNDLTEKMHEDPEQSMEAHNVNGLAAKGTMM